AEIDAGAGPARAEALDRTALACDLAAAGVRPPTADRPLPFEAKVRVAGLHREARDLDRGEARAMQIELGVAEAIGKAARPRDQLCAEHLVVERVRALPVGNMDDAVIKLDRQCHASPLRAQDPAAFAVP